METNILKNNSADNYAVRYYWQHNMEGDSFLHLGVMKNAIVIRKVAIPSNTWVISPSSYFPFPKEYYNERFTSREMAIEKATEFFRMWFADAINNLL